MANFVSSLTGQQLNQALLDVQARIPEGWAVGQYNGVDVGSGSPYYQNNAKYYANLARSAVPSGVSGAVLWNASMSLTAAQKSQARANIQAGGSNRNLLDNGWFQINQRGQTSYTQATQAYSLDRWRWLGGTTGKINVNSPYGITMWQSDTSAGNHWLVQRMANSEALYGETLTISANIDGTIYSYTGTCPSTVTTREQLFINAFPKSGCYLRLGLQPTGYVQADFAVYTDTPIVLNAMKVEKGNYSTLANDTLPDYTEELLKCQRYFLRITGSDSINFGYGMSFGDGSSIRALIPTPVTMRQLPSIAKGGTIYVRGLSSVRAATSIAAFTVQSNGIVVDVRSASSYTGNNVYGLWGEIGSYLNLSAEL